MKTYRKDLWFNVAGRRGMVNITQQVRECVTESGVLEGLALVNVMHITASVFINDEEASNAEGATEWQDERPARVEALTH